MSSCTTGDCGVTADCGIGGWTGPKPGDPDNNISISASTAPNGIQVNWTYPQQNGHAVAHFKLKRSTSSNISTAIDLAIVSGSTYLDLLNPDTPTEYFYWIQAVSVNGTVAAPIGPAAATAYPRKRQLLDDLHRAIDESVLAGLLRERIEDITLNYDELTGMIGERIATDAALAAALQRVREGLDESIGLIHTEARTRSEGQNALAEQLLTIAAVNQTNAAAILEDRIARVSADEALAASISRVAAANATTAALVQNETNARVTATNALAQQINNVQVNMNGQFSAVRQDMRAEIDSVTGQLNSIYTLRVQNGDRIGGFGIHGTPQNIDFAVVADRFWIDVPFGQGRRKPFIVQDGTVYIEKAVIREATIETLHLGSNAATAGISTRFGWPTAIATGGSSTTLASLQVHMGDKPSGSSVIIMITLASIYIRSSGDPGHAILVSGNSGFSVQAPCNVSPDGSLAVSSFTLVDTAPRAGMNSYTVSFLNGYNARVTGFMALMGSKR